ncbi:hypothetical protein GGI17_000628 [Coemansia sp. S146]|nr:hypothetical protein GGI17_000628 [Coemansia sp. S146]
MTTLSLFQILPTLVVELIVDYIASYKSDTPSVDAAEANTNSAIRRAECTVRFIGTDHNMRAVIRNTWPGRFKNLNVPVNLLAKELLIKVSLRDIYFDKALSMLLGQYDIVHAFPKVRSLEFQFTLIYSDLDTTTNSQEIRRRIILFAQHIGQVVPMVRKMSVSLNCSFDRVPQTPAPLFGDLVLQLYRFAGQIEHCRDCDTVDIKLQPSIIHNLTTIDCHIDENIKLFMVLAHPVAPALQYMAIKSKMSVDVSGLVRNPSGGKYVQYACMRTLKLDQAPVLAISWHAVFAGALPFPDLRRLEILYDYPFGDDTLFRGNAATLEYLQIQLVNLTVSMLKKHRVFTPVSHPKLRRVKVWYEEEDMPSALSTTSDYLCFVLNISCNASICSFYGVSGVLEQQSELSLFDDYLHSRVLEMPDVRLGIWYAFDLINLDLRLDGKIIPILAV